MGLIQEETGGGSGYDHPSPSIPLPVEGRGKPVATRPAIFGALAASVTCCKSRHLHNVFLKSEAFKVPAPQADGVAARLRPPPEGRAGRVVFGWGWGMISDFRFDISK